MTRDRLLAAGDQSQSDSKSSGLQEQGLDLAFAHDSNLKRYVNGVKQTDRGTKELGAGELTLVASAEAMALGARTFGWLGAGAGLLLTTAGMLNLKDGAETAKAARLGIDSKKYGNLLQSGDKILDGADWMSDSAVGTGAVALGIFAASRLGMPYSNWVGRSVMLGGWGVGGLGYYKAQGASDSFDSALTDVSRRAIDDANKPRLSVDIKAGQQPNKSFALHAQVTGAAQDAIGAQSQPRFQFNLDTDSSQNTNLPSIISILQRHLLAGNSPFPALPHLPEITHAQPGQQAAPSNLYGLDGGKFDLSALTAKGPVVLDFGATWCGPCKAALPIEAAVAKSKGVSFVFVDEQEDAAKVQAYLKSQGLNVNVALDRDGSVGFAYHVTGIPQTIIIGKDGVAHRMPTGYTPDLKDKLSKELDAIIAGK